MAGNFMAICKKCDKCGKEYLIAYQSPDCPHPRFIDDSPQAQQAQKELEEALERYGGAEKLIKDLCNE